MLRLSYIVVGTIFLGIFFGIGVAMAACSPGIPCTDYSIYDNNSAGTSADYNGPKTGAPAPYTNATGATTSACDGNFMNQIYSRAYMEASREVIMSEQLIHKPDSVLEYTCFDEYINKAAHNAGTSFSESTEWEDVELELWVGGEHEQGGSRNHNHSCSTTCPDESATTTYTVIFDDDHLDDALEILLISSLEEYIDNNFDHTYMGESLTIDSSMSNSIGGDTYVCSEMATVWDLSRCADFGEDDRFRSFKHLVDFDPRTIPQSCSPSYESDDSIEAGEDVTKIDGTYSGGGFGSRMPSDADIDTSTSEINDPCLPAGSIVSGVNTGFSNDLIRVANNCDVSGELNAYSSFDIMKTYTAMIKGFGVYIPGADDGASIVPGAILCSAPIPTGIPIITYGITTTVPSSGIETIKRSYLLHYDHICPNPGCYYQPVKIPYLWGVPIPAVGRETSVLGTTIPEALAIGICLPF